MDVNLQETGPIQGAIHEHQETLEKKYTYIRVYIYKG